jgi:hypothetical protein
MIVGVMIIDGPAEIEMIETITGTTAAIETAIEITIVATATGRVTTTGIASGIIADPIGPTGTGAIMIIGETSDS